MEQPKKPNIVEILLENQKQMIDAMNNVGTALKAINDTNVLHFGKEDARYDLIQQLVSGNKAVMGLFNKLLLMLAGAVIIVAGAEEIFKYLHL